MTIEQPNIDISFIQSAYSFVERSARGNVALIIKDDTDETFIQKDYKTITELTADAALYTAENLQYIKDTMQGGPFKTTVFRIATTEGFESALTLIEGALTTGWVGFADGLPTDYATLATWTKQMAANKKTFMSAVFAPTTPPASTNVVELGNTMVNFMDARGEVSGDVFIPSLLGYLAGANVDKGTTYLTMGNLTSVTVPEDVDAELKLGKMVLINEDDAVKISLGINTLTEVTEDLTEDFKFIETIEVNNLMLDDIRTEFKKWIGKYKNIYDNQVIFLSAINNYFKTLEDANILDSNYENLAEVDVDAQRAVWVAVNPLAVDWTDAKVKSQAFKRQLFLKANVKELQSITDLNFIISLA
ncbi:phage tail sheath C-terminal domain-containing protein [Clostridium sp.]|jgi:hypothetical protein|uniref:phage tail sheath C-terminal domain-containing protein n=1 Tax=Clostridium sp. TaxID=1506 RepID=UPI003EED9F73